MELPGIPLDSHLHCLQATILVLLITLSPWLKCFPCGAEKAETLRAS